MKKAFLFSSILAFLVACGGKFGDNEFLVKGVIKNSKNNKLVLSEHTNNGPIVVDSVEVEDNGEFKLTGRTSDPKFYMLKISPNEYITLIIDSANVLNVTADADDFVRSHKVEGSEDMALLKKLNDRIIKTYEQLDSIGKIYMEYEGTSQEDSIKPFIIKAQQIIEEEQRAFSKSFIDSNAHSFSCIIALSQQFSSKRKVFNIPNDIEYYEKVQAKLTERYPQSENVKTLSAHIEYEKAKLAQLQAMQSQFKVGDQVPDISLADPNGKNISLYSLRGKYVLLDFWAGWCGPCRVENPILVENYNKFKAKGFEIFQVSLDEKESLWKKAIKDDGLSAWHHVSDLQGWDSSAARAYNISKIPANFLLDPNGKVIAVNLRGEQLGVKLTEVLK